MDSRAALPMDHRNAMPERHQIERKRHAACPRAQPGAGLRRIAAGTDRRSSTKPTINRIENRIPAMAAAPAGAQR
jgi:hypothetical protein